MAGSLQRPPFKTPSYCICKSARNYRQKLLDLQCNHNYHSSNDRKEPPQNQYQYQNYCRRHYHHHLHQQQYLRFRPHFKLQSHQPGDLHKNQIRNAKLQSENRERKQVNHFQTFSKLSNGCMPCLNGCDRHVTDIVAVANLTKATEYVLEPNLQITSFRFKSLAKSDEKFSLMVNHSQLSSSTFCVLSKSIE